MVSFVLKPITQSVSEGGKLSFSITIVNPNYKAIPEYRIYFRTHPTKSNAATASDYAEVYSLKAVTFSAKTGATQTFTIRTDEDDLVEGREYFSVALYDFQKKYLGIESVFTIKDNPLADLSVGPLKLGATSVAAGGEVKISWSVGNDGPGEARSNTGLFYLSSNDRFDRNDDVRLDAAVSIRSLDDDERTSGTVTLKIPDDWPKGKSYIIFLADAEGDVRETVEKNNSTSVEVQVTAPAPAPWRTVNEDMVLEMAELIDNDGGVSSKWTRISAEELGLKSGATYTFSRGKYVGGPDQGQGTNAEANATLYGGIVDGKKTLVIVFPGSAGADRTDWMAFDAHYKKFAPLVTAVENYINKGTVQQVFLTGHSLGAGMVDNFMATHAGNLYKAFTFGSPGGSMGGRGDDRASLISVIPMTGCSYRSHIRATAAQLKSTAECSLLHSGQQNTASTFTQRISSC